MLFSLLLQCIMVNQSDSTCAPCSRTTPARCSWRVRRWTCPPKRARHDTINERWCYAYDRCLPPPWNLPGSGSTMQHEDVDQGLWVRSHRRGGRHRLLAVRSGRPRRVMMLVTEPYAAQVARWPRAGHQILAQFTDDAVVVYQAYRPAIGHFAARHKFFGDAFRLNRMSWIKPNFLWMMYRSGWGTREGQEVTLGLRLGREFFDSLLARAVASAWDPRAFARREEWSQAVAGSSVRLQWDPDHHPSGAS